MFAVDACCAALVGCVLCCDVVEDWGTEEGVGEGMVCLVLGDVLLLHVVWLGPVKAEEDKAAPPAQHSHCATPSMPR